MRSYASFLLSALFILGPVSPAHPQAVEAPLDITQSGQDYLSKIRLSRIQSSVAYFDPTAPAPELDTNERLRPSDLDVTKNWQWDDLDGPLTIITIAFLAAIAVLFWRYGGASGLALRKGVQNPNRGTVALGSDLVDSTGAVTELGDILQNPDRQAALISLSQLLISNAVAANGLLLQRSWTVRDVLRRMPVNAAWLPELKDLVLLGERVQFRDQPVSEDDFQGFATRARPILSLLAS